MNTHKFGGATGPESRRIGENNRDVLCKFTWFTGCMSVPLLSHAMGYKEKTASELLRRYQKEGLIQRADRGAMSFRVWILTKDGLARAKNCIPSQYLDSADPPTTPRALGNKVLHDLLVGHMTLKVLGELREMLGRERMRLSSKHLLSDRVCRSIGLTLMGRGVPDAVVRLIDLEDGRVTNVYLELQESSEDKRDIERRCSLYAQDPDPNFMHFFVGSSSSNILKRYERVLSKPITDYTYNDKQRRWYPQQTTSSLNDMEYSFIDVSDWASKYGRRRLQNDFSGLLSEF